MVLFISYWFSAFGGKIKYFSILRSFWVSLLLLSVAYVFMGYI